MGSDRYHIGCVGQVSVRGFGNRPSELVSDAGVSASGRHLDLSS